MPGALTKEDFLIRLRARSGNDWAFLNTTDAKLFFNRARCECAAPVQIVVEMSDSGYAKRAQISTGNVLLRLGGTECLAETATARTGAMCETVGGEIRLSDLAIRRREIDTTVNKVFVRRVEGAAAVAESCTAEFTQTLWLWVDADMNGTPDLLTGSAPSLGIELDGKPPPPPANLDVTSGNEALRAKWNPLQGIPDFGGYLVFCARGGEYPVFADSGYSDQYHFCERAAGPPPAQTTSPAGQRAGSGSPVAPPEALRRLDPAYLCSDLLTSQTEARISILENGVPYVVGVASVDRRGNASPIETAVLQSPVPTRDFYKGYRAAGGLAEGGCYLGRDGGRPARSHLVLAFVAAVLLRARRKAAR